MPRTYYTLTRLVRDLVDTLRTAAADLEGCRQPDSHVDPLAVAGVLHRDLDRILRDFRELPPEPARECSGQLPPWAVGMGPHARDERFSPAESDPPAGPFGSEVDRG